ncbi:Mini-ribonuclease 3 [Clostridium sporogenes]|jgi:ribonuclease-3 family protein|uniref:Mini-ribonuclease 3 n=4 Tax=Clostridium TaxID=1485 RepID=A0A1J1CZU7_CLOSG|nr:MULTISPECIES: Mini-ribonuclease 3 [Clostridium]AJD29634.1 ribonuclease III domain protein [Clostridium botulinum Prevot_594]MBE6078577.1 Mini-ribonuclease 3 [Clostridium lundense]AKC64354.1 mini-ribonuclease 3 [Clostridium sporogenes]AKJ91473.1 Mini-ribonuclease 3 [Clostridium sporogenes]APF28052.1 ribonuclease III domain protein [Clostridium sporogenes]
MDFSLFQNKFTIKDGKTLNPLVLAFIGDAVYEVFIRTFLVDNNRELNVHKLHVNAIKYVKAHGQSDCIKDIMGDLNEDELYIFKRGRNAKSGTVPKNADVQEYRFATGFEALIGFLYITDQQERLNYLLNNIVTLNGKKGALDNES